MVSNKKGFTLIEMLIVVTIIGLLAAALIPRLQGAQARARDATRKTDFATIRTALTIFYSDNARYPFNSTCGGSAPFAESKSTCAGSWLTTDTSFYNIITTVPVDPLNQTNGGGGAWITSNYVYNYLNSNQYSAIYSIKLYDLFGQLENKKDPDRCEIANRTYNTFGVPRCNPWPSSPGYSPYIYTDH